MDLQEVMNQKVFAVLGNTENPEKYAFQIKAAMKEAGYQVYAVPKEILPSMTFQKIWISSISASTLSRA